MRKIDIELPCPDCPLNKSGNILDIYDNHLLPMAMDGLERALGCRHPWRVANLRFKGRPNTPQSEVLSRLVELRGKRPEDYGLAPTSSIEVLTLSEADGEIVQIMTGSFLEVLERMDTSEDPVELEELLGDLYSRDDSVPELVDLAYSKAKEIREEN